MEATTAEDRILCTEKRRLRAGGTGKFGKKVVVFARLDGLKMGYRMHGQGSAKEQTRRHAQRRIHYEHLADQRVI